MHFVDTFNEHRPYLFAIAYRMMGTVADAEDTIQEAFLKWQQAARSEIESPRAWLSTVVTRLCIDQLRSARVQRESYYGPWLPAPLITTPADQTSHATMLAESLSMAFLVVLESLSPAERAAFLLRDVFEYGYDDVARILEKNEAACRQLVRRAREHVADRRQRFDVKPDQQRAVVDQFFTACATGDMDGMLKVLSDDVTVWSDGGGKVSAATRPVFGPDRVARLLLGLMAKTPAGFEARPTLVNDQPGVVCFLDGVVYSTLSLNIVGDGVRDIFIVRNPDKLTHLQY